MGRKIVVVGDVMLDQRTIVRTTGPSKENTAVMVAKAETVQYNLGGAANVARCVKAIGGDVRLLGFNNNKKVEHLTDFWCLFDNPPHGMTPVKNRIVTQDGHYMLRLDEESNFFGRGDEWWNGGGAELGKAFGELMFPGGSGNQPVVCLADYDKGCLTKAAARALLYHVNAVHESFHFPVIVDPGRHGLWEKFGSSRTIFRANLFQAYQLYQHLRNTRGGIGTPPWEPGLDVTQKLKREEYESILYWTGRNLQAASIPYAYLVLTLGPGGIIGAPCQSEKEAYYAYYASGPDREVVDACGAGDVVTATMATMLADAEDPLSLNAITGALRTAQNAAQIAVAKAGVYAVTREDMGWGSTSTDSNRTG